MLWVRGMHVVRVAALQVSVDSHILQITADEGQGSEKRSVNGTRWACCLFPFVSLSFRRAHTRRIVTAITDPNEPRTIRFECLLRLLVSN